MSDIVPSNSGTPKAMTSREYIAALALQGILAARNDKPIHLDANINGLTELAIKYADEMLEQLAEKRDSES